MPASAIRRAKRSGRIGVSACPLRLDRRVAVLDRVDPVSHVVLGNRLGEEVGLRVGVALEDRVDPLGGFVAQLLRVEQPRMLAEPQHPCDQLPWLRVLGREHGPGPGDALARRAPLLAALRCLLEGAVATEVALHEPRDPLRDPHLCLTGGLAQLPVRPLGVGPRVEVLGGGEVVLRLGGVGHLLADPREPEHADVVALVRVPDEVELAALVEQVVRVHLALRGVVALDRVVVELDRLAARDRGLHLRQPLGELAAAGRGGDGHRHLALVTRSERAGPSPRELLEGQAQRLRVGEAAVEQRERGLERPQLAVRELDRREVEVLRRERVELRLEVALRRLLDLQVDAERLQLGAVGVEAARESVVVHLAVALDVLLDLERGHGPALGHQERDQRELPDEFFGVLCHGESASPRGVPRIVREPRTASSMEAGGKPKMADVYGAVRWRALWR